MSNEREECEKRREGPREGGERCRRKKGGKKERRKASERRRCTAVGPIPSRPSTGKRNRNYSRVCFTSALLVVCLRPRCAIRSFSFARPSSLSAAALQKRSARIDSPLACSGSLPSSSSFPASLSLFHLSRDLTVRHCDASRLPLLLPLALSAALARRPAHLNPRSSPSRCSISSSSSPSPPHHRLAHLPWSVPPPLPSLPPSSPLADPLPPSRQSPPFTAYTPPPFLHPRTSRGTVPKRERHTGMSTSLRWCLGDRCVGRRASFFLFCFSPAMREGRTRVGGRGLMLMRLGVVGMQGTDHGE